MGYKRLSCRVHSGIEGLIRKFPTILAEFALRAYDKILRTLGGEDMITTYFGAHMYCNTSDLIRRIPDKQILVEEVAASEQDRNANHAKANWRFTTPDARASNYPSI